MTSTAEGHLHDGLLPLDSYSVLIIAVHPDVLEPRDVPRCQAMGVRARRPADVSGREWTQCEVVFAADGSMRCLSHLHSLHGEMGGKSGDGSLEYESRMHRTFESEASLLGVVCSETGIMTAAPFRVIDASHWVFAGTGLNNN